MVNLQGSFTCWIQTCSENDAILLHFEKKWWIQLEPSFLVTQCISLQFRWNLMETVNNKKFAWQEEKFVSETEQMAETKT